MRSGARTPKPATGPDVPARGGWLRRHGHGLVLLLAGGALAGVTATWIVADSSMQSFADSGGHHTASMRLAQTLRLQGLAGAWDFIKGINVLWPPGTFVLHGLSGYWSHGGHLALRLANLLYVPLLLLGVYALGLRFGQRKTAALAAVLTLFGPGLAFHLRHVCIDNAATVVVLYGMLALMVTRQRGQRWLLLLGVVSGVGLLFRVQYLFFVVPPALLLVLTWLRRPPPPHSRSSTLLWMLLAAAAAALVAGPYWGPNLTQLWTLSLSHLTSDFSVPGVHSAGPDEGLLTGLLYYAAAAGKLVGWPVLAVAICLVPRLVRRRPRVWYLLLWVAGAILCGAMTIAREPRYLLPLVPALALLAALGLEQLSPRLRSPLTVVLLLVTVAPTLLVAGLGLEIPPRGPASLLFHGEYYRAAEGQARDVEARNIAARLEQVLSRRGGHRSHVLIGGVPADRQQELLIFLSPMLPAVRFSTTQEGKREAYHQWRGQRPADTSYYLLSLSQQRLLPLLWIGRYAAKPMRLYQVPAVRLKWLMSLPPAGF